MPTHPRYRVDAGAHCIDVRLSSIEQMFDNRDPAPFRRRDLDPALLEYLVDAAEDLQAHGPMRVVLWFPTAVDAERVVPAYRAHFDYELTRVARRRRRERRTALAQLALGALLLIALVTLGQLAGDLPRLGAIAREGLTISAWVILWRPIQGLVYDWIPAYRERRTLARLRAAPVELAVGDAGA